MKQIKAMKDVGAHLITISSNGDWVIYHFSHEGKIKNLKFELNKNKQVSTITKIYPGAEMYERELMEKYQLKFRGHPNPVKLFT